MNQAQQPFHRFSFLLTSDSRFSCTMGLLAYS
jgi:hypothetical protein